jgi:hypothetical protein
MKLRSDNSAASCFLHVRKLSRLKTCRKAGSYIKPKLFSDSPYAQPVVATSPGKAHSHGTPKRAKDMASVPEAGPSKYMKPVDLHTEVRMRSQPSTSEEERCYKQILKKVLPKGCG